VRYRRIDVQLFNKEMSEFVVVNQSTEITTKKLFMGMSINFKLALLGGHASGLASRQVGRQAEVTSGMRADQTDRQEDELADRQEGELANRHTTD